MMHVNIQALLQETWLRCLVNYWSYQRFSGNNDTLTGKVVEYVTCNYYIYNFKKLSQVYPVPKNKPIQKVAFNKDFNV